MMQQELLFADLRPSPLNPRKHARSDEALDALADSIVDKGVLQNLIARNTPTGLEIVAGEGRYRAVARAIEQGRLPADYALPVSVRDLNDEQAIEIALIENLQRENLHPLDEADAFAALYDMKAKAGGKKAAAGAVKFLAEKMHRTPRYVQKRIKIARDLIPEWRAQLDAGALHLNIAQLLSSCSEAEQKERFAAECEDGAPNADWISRLSATDFSNNWRLLSTALFERKLYEGGVEEVDGEDFATDAKAFDAAQKIAAAALTKELRASAKAGDIAFFDEAMLFNRGDYEVQTIDGKPDPTAGVLMVKSHDGEFELHRGLFKTESKVKSDARGNKAKAKRAKPAPAAAKAKAKSEPDPRVATVQDFVRDTPVTAMAVELYHSLSACKDAVKWFGDGASTPPSDIARKLLRELNGGNLASGANLLDFLLNQKLSALAPAWAAMKAEDVGSGYGDNPFGDAPTKVEQLLLDHCGAKIAAAPAKTPDPKAPKKTASKSKPGKRAKRT